MSSNQNQRQTNTSVVQSIFQDLVFVSKILADGFFSEGTNIFIYQVEKLKTYLSLEACYPQKKDADLHKYFVACEKGTGKVIGFVEVDCRTSKKNTLQSSPYMCNLAVNQNWKRRGIATSLVFKSEEVAMKNGKEGMFLKVREGNEPAFEMYRKLGYDVESSEFDAREAGKKATIVLMRKEFYSLIKETNNIK